MSQMTAAAAADSVANMLNDAEEQNDDIIPFDLYNFEQVCFKSPFNFCDFQFHLFHFYRENCLRRFRG